MTLTCPCDKMRNVIRVVILLVNANSPLTQTDNAGYRTDARNATRMNEVSKSIRTKYGGNNCTSDDKTEEHSTFKADLTTLGHRCYCTRRCFAYCRCSVPGFK